MIVSAKFSPSCTARENYSNETIDAAVIVSRRNVTSRDA